MGGGGNSLASTSCGDDKKRRVCYYYDAGIASADYGEHHVMVPKRVTMAHNLVSAYGLLGHMRRLRTAPATESDLAAFHDAGYLALLRSGAGDADRGVDAAGERGGGGFDDNPAFDGLWDYCLRYAGGSLAAARALAGDSSDIAINWSGGMHHACAGKASGFCYVNDIVLAIRALLGRFRRVLYVDVDVHHGDGVEAAFAGSSRVMTVSFHQHGDNFFPESGELKIVGKGQDERCAVVNVPLKKGFGDEEYHQLFEPIMGRVMEVFDPEAVVMQCGADSLDGDRLGSLKLTLNGHAQCVSFLRSFNRPLLLLGGGGYTINHVASCWCNETAVAIGKDIPNDIPKHGFDQFYQNHGYRLHYTLSQGDKNKKNAKYVDVHKPSIDKLKQQVLENLSKLKLEPVASVQFEERGRSIDVDALYESREDEESPSERLYRKCYLENKCRKQRRLR
uniref:Histone deacetylase n=1 Tax=Leersia perrieri TaxID=77586 RepID=A0A0D9V2C8_9ORYZ